MGRTGPGAPPALSPILPVDESRNQGEATGVEWRKLTRDSMLFLTIMHSFRWATEAGTRAGGIGVGSAYTRAVGNLHGWGDGDPFYVNYVGHPMQGAVAGRLFLLNDPRFNHTEFGKDPEYWKGKLRAALFAWAFSEQFEIGLLSEASIGHIQKDFPQQGFVDHVITPTIGTVLMVAEDAADRFVIQPLEAKTTNRWLRIALRTGLNPARGFANVIDGRAPWDRTSRPGVLEYMPVASRTVTGPVYVAAIPHDLKPAPFEFTISPSLRQFGGSSCFGGGGEAAYRVKPELQLVLAVNGCKLLGLETDFTGDALVYQIGPRWTPAPIGKWSPYAHFLFGGMKVTQQQFYPAKKQALIDANPSVNNALLNELHDQYTDHVESSGMAISIGTGLDYKLNAAMALRVASIEYLRSNIGSLNGSSYNAGFQVTTGFVLRLGTW